MKLLNRFFSKLLTFMLLCILFFIQGLIFYAPRNDFEIKEKYIFVLGAKSNGGNISNTLKERLDNTILYMNKYSDSIAVLCGGVESGDKFSQSHYMLEYLVENGINKDRLIEESESKNTFENIKFGLLKLDTRPSTVMVISSDYHIFRAKMIFHRFGILAKSFPSKTPKGEKIKSNVRETLAIIKSFIFDRPSKSDLEKVYSK